MSAEWLKWILQIVQLYFIRKPMTFLRWELLLISYLFNKFTLINLDIIINYQFKLLYHEKVLKKFPT